MAWARSTNGWQQTAKTSCTLEYKRYMKKAWKTTKELDRHHITRFEKHRHDLGSSTTARCQQRRLALTCGPMSFTRDELRSKVRTKWQWPQEASCSQVVHLSVHLSVTTKLVNTIFWKRMNWFWCKSAKMVRGARAWNNQFWGSGGQRSRSHEADDRFGDLAEVSFLTSSVK